MIISNRISIEDKVVLTKTANALTIVTNETSIDTVNINADIYKFTPPPSGTLPPVSGSLIIKTPVFFDTFNVNVSDLPGTGSLEQKVITYVCDTWNLTLK